MAVSLWTKASMVKGLPSMSIPLPENSLLTVASWVSTPI